MTSAPVGSETLWRQDENEALALGCVGCPLLDVCGGLRVAGPVLDCMAFCVCKDPQNCHIVCFHNAAHFTARMCEVKGPGLDTVRRYAPLPFVPVRGYAPLLYHGSTRKEALRTQVVALPLFALFDRRTGLAKYNSRVELADAFRFSPESRIILSGTAPDRPLERLWNLEARDDLLRQLVPLEPDIITSLNFSAFNDVPRPDNLYNIKRVFLTWAEIIGSGLPSAIPIIARTQKDYERYTTFIAERDEVTHLSAEFATGAGAPTRIGWHAEQLCKLAIEVRRPLQLVVRGGLRILPELSRAFENVLMLDTDPFVKTMKRQLGFLTNRLSLAWRPWETSENEPLDGLLQHNVEVRRSYHDLVLDGRVDPLRSAGYKEQVTASRHKRRKDTETSQLSFLDYDRAFEAGVAAVDNQPVITTSKP